MSRLRICGRRLSWSMTAITYFGEMLVASVLAITLLAISPLETRYAGALFAGGAVAWTLSEYAVHRFVLHNLTPTQHALYHANPDEPVLTVAHRAVRAAIAANSYCCTVPNT